MVRRKKVSVEAIVAPPRTRRSARTSIAAVPDENDSRDSADPVQSPVALSAHKNFGKYRCLSFKNPESPRLPDGDLEVKVVDPCATSESDNSSSLETDQTTAPGSDSGSPRSAQLRVPELSDSDGGDRPDGENEITLSAVSFDTQLPDPTLDILSRNDPRRGFTSSLDNFGEMLDSISPLLKEDSSNDASDRYGDECEAGGTIVADDEEMYTVIKIIGEDPENCTLYCESEPYPDPNRSDRDSFPESPTEPQPMEPDDVTATAEDSRVASESCEIQTDVPEKIEPFRRKKTAVEARRGEESCSTPTSVASEEEARAMGPSNYSTDSSSSSSAGVRRSSRIKTITVQKQRSKGHGLVKSPQKFLTLAGKDANRKKNDDSLRGDSVGSPSTLTPQISPVFSVPTADVEMRPVKVKSRWRRSSEMEMGSRSPVTPPLNSPNVVVPTKLSLITENSSADAAEKTVDSNAGKMECSRESSVERAIRERLGQFQNILENEYHCDRAASKEARKMTCDCFLTEEEIERGEMGCGEDCLNRLLMIECNSRCPIGDRCTNRRFQSNQYSSLRVFKTEKKGLGIQAVEDIPGGEFLMEYVGEVLNWQQFNQRAQEYSSDKNTHHYFMSLKGDAVIDATLKGNISRFINHSCDPNAETQKWTVNGDLRIGFFSKRSIKAGHEITFDYQFQRYGKEGLRCFCEASNCRGWIGEEPDNSDEEEEIETETEENTTSEVQIDSIVDKAKKESVKVDSMKVDQISSDDASQQKESEKKSPKKRYTARKSSDLLQDMDLEEEMNNLNRSGVKNQSHTLSLCRAMVRAKHINERISLLKLLAAADFPCRRLFLDYRGLRLLAPWCEKADASFRLEMLSAFEKLPIRNRTILKENKILSTVEQWIAETSSVCSFGREESSDDSIPGTPVLIDESTGLPIENNNKLNHLNASSTKEGLENSCHKKAIKEIVPHTNSQREDIKKLSKELLVTWASLQEDYKIPKNKRIQLMKEHERQANEPQPKNDKDKELGKDKERWEERYKRHDRDKKRPLLPSPDMPRRNQIRLDDRVLAAIPPMSKEERRKEFEARVARQEQLRHAQSTSQIPTVIPMDQSVSRGPPPSVHSINHWGPPPEHVQNSVQNSYGGMLVNGVPPVDYSAPDYVQGEYMPMDYTHSDYIQPPNTYQMPYCGPPPQHVYPIPSMNSAVPPPVPGYNFNTNYAHTSFPNHNYNPTPSLSNSSPFQNIPLPPSSSNIQIISPHSNTPSLSLQVPQPIPSLTNQHISSTENQPIPTIASISNLANQPKGLVPQPIPTLVPSTAPSYPYHVENTQNDLDMGYYLNSSEATDTSFQNQDLNTSIVSIPPSSGENHILSSEVNEVVRWTPVRLPSKWRSMKDSRGRTYYYHRKLRIPQWSPPLYSPTLNSKDDDSSIDEQASSDEDVQAVEPVPLDVIPIVREKLIEGVNGIYQVMKEDKATKKNGIVKEVLIGAISTKKKRPGLYTEKIISPRLEEDKIAAKLDLKRYKENKERLRRKKEMALTVAGCPDSQNKYKKRVKSSKQKVLKDKDPEASERAARKIKDVFRGHMARVMVHHLDPYRRDDCPIGRITNTADFKHLARKLTHFVMLKELKHCQTVDDLECNDSVKQKAKEFVKKYMAKYGPVYQRPPEEMEC